jgi:hypothetical protein
MFTLEESALLGRMLRTTAVLVVCTITGVGYLLLRRHLSPAAPASSVPPPATHTASASSPGHRHAPHYVPPPTEAQR